MKAILLFLALGLCCAGASASRAERLFERSIDLPVKSQQLGDVPIVDPPTRVAGYFKLNRTHDARMFYFYFQARRNTETAPLVLWMTGGPGCSSEIALFYENGPYSIENQTLIETKYGWDVMHNMIFVDQPIGTGFSYSKDPRDRVYNEKGVADDMLDFLYAFYEAHPELEKTDFFVTGESYAGHYVPAVSSRIYRANELGQGPMTIPLRGLAIGNGLTAPAVQFPAYADFALQNKLISQSLHDRMQFFMPLCRWGAEFCSAHDWRWACIVALEVCQIIGFEPVLAANPGINVYDITKKCEGDLCYDMTAADDYLNRPDVRKALGVGDRPWSACDMSVHGDMMGDWLKSYDQLLPAMLEDGIRVMIYAGDLDLICNWVGNERWVDLLEWEHSAGWPAAKAANWSVSGKVAGTVRQLETLSFVRVFQAGHMVPMDQPRPALAMISRFTHGQPLTSDWGEDQLPPLGPEDQGSAKVDEQPGAGQGPKTSGAAALGAMGVKRAGRDTRVRQATYLRDKYPTKLAEEAGSRLRVGQQEREGREEAEAVV